MKLQRETQPGAFSISSLLIHARNQRYPYRINEVCVAWKFDMDYMSDSTGRDGRIRPGRNAKRTLSRDSVSLPLLTFNITFTANVACNEARLLSLISMIITCLRPSG